MSRIAKMNYTGLALCLVSIAASSAILSGCGQPPQPGRPAGTVPGMSTGPIYSPQGVPTDLSQLQNAQPVLNAIMGNYGGQLEFEGDDGWHTQDYAIHLSAAAAQPQYGYGYGQGQGQTMNVNLTSGNLRISSPAQVQLSRQYDGSAFVIVTTYPQNIPSLSYYPVQLQLKLIVSAANAYDPNQSAIRIADSQSAYRATSEHDPVFFLGLLGRR